MNSIIKFHHGFGLDHRGRSRDEILSQDDQFMESTHDFVQWLFPAITKSSFNPWAPTLDNEDIKAFHKSKELRDSILKCLERMNSFFAVIHPWKNQHDHNLLRLTRILDCLVTVGLRDRAENITSL